MSLRVGYFQFAPVFGEPETNLSRVVSGLQQAEADLIVLPELPFSGYLFEDRNELATLAEEPTDSAAVDTLAELCQKRGFHLVTGFTERAGDKLYNSALLIGPQGLIHTYRKLHLFNTETEYFDPGDTPLVTHEICGAHIGIMVCYDWAFPEVARSLALQGADIICHPSNLVLPWGQQAMQVRCLENSMYAITTNRFGTDERSRGSVTFTGQSQITGPRGEIIHQAEQQDEELFITEIDPAKARDKQIAPLNHLINDRRPEFYTTVYK
ncbi:nitrilase-related carbon-nitrogen hydrolase [Pseudomonadota bacterium]